MILCSLLVPFIITLVLYTTNGLAWGNKNPDDREVDMDNWAAYNRAYHYATHDWIAEIAVSRIRNDPKWTTKDGQPFWTDRRILIYLYATAGPDRWTVVFNDFNGKPIKGMGDATYHRFRFDPVTREPLYNWDVRNILNGINDVLTGKKTSNVDWDGLMHVLAVGDCDAAAFYMGMLSHYIDDLACFPHLIDVDDVHHSAYENRVAMRTDCTEGLSTGPFLEAERYECFLINLGFTIPPLKTPARCAIDLGYDTRFDSRITSTAGIYDAEWMDQNLYNVIWPSARNDWYTEVPDPSDTTYQYMNRVEKSLQHAVEAVATGLNWVIDTHLAHHKVLECKCGESQELTKTKLVQKLLTDYLFVSLWLVIGYFASILTVSLALSPFAVH